jgi:hypothetical protein
MFFSTWVKLVQRCHRIEKMAAISGLVNGVIAKRLAKSTPTAKNACQPGSSVI